MKNTTVSARVEDEVKAQAESILNQLGIPVSVVINSLYHQIILRKGIPFPLTLPTNPKTLDEMSREELYDKLAHSYAQSVAEKCRPYDLVFDELENE